MERQDVLTKAKESDRRIEPQRQIVNEQGVVLSVKDAEEFRAYKRRKIVEEIMAGMHKSSAYIRSEAETARICERALRLKQAAIKLPLTRLASVRKRLGNGKVKLDCRIGDSGETTTKVKVYETKVALRGKAKEITVAITPSLIATGRFDEIRKDLRAVRRAAKGALVKATVVEEVPFSVLSRLARLTGEVGLQFFSVGYFPGCERLRFDLINGCKLEVTGVQTLTDFKRLLAVGVARIVTDSAWEIYNAWMQEADKIEFVKKRVPVETEKQELPVEEGRTKDVSTPEPTQETPALPADRPCVQPKTNAPVPVSKIVEKNGIAERSSSLSGFESSELKFL